MHIFVPLVYSLLDQEQIEGDIVVVNLLDYDIVISKFELESRYYINFRTNTYKEMINHLLPSFTYGICSTTAVLLQEWL